MLGVGTIFGGGGNSDPAKAKNTTGTFEIDIPAGDTEILVDEDIQLVDVNDNLIQSYTNPLYEDLEIQVPVFPVKSGIQYQRPLPKNIILSQQLYDEAWHYSSGAYDSTSPSDPVSCAVLDWSASVPFLTLLHNNAFGNKERFTDELGTQVYANNYAVDNLTGLGWVTDLISTNTWVNHLNNSNTFELTSLGYSDFRVLNYSEWSSVSFVSVDRVTLRHQPFGITSNSIIALSTNSIDSGRLYIAYNYYGQISRTGFSTTNYNTMYVRNHF